MFRITALLLLLLLGTALAYGASLTLFPFEGFARPVSVQVQSTFTPKKAAPSGTKSKLLARSWSSVKAMFR